jgi:16S rRNA (cytidine1402-2'-O)-methyltransferase
MALKSCLYVVGTPIGNLEDLSFRALRVLKEMDLIACEDTRRTRKLLSHFSIHVPCLSYHSYNRERREREIIRRLKAGDRVALVTDAGSPGISDLGQELVNLAVSHGFRVETVPGPSAITAAIGISGLRCGRFIFYGFLPRSSGKRRKILASFKKEKFAHIFFESPLRVRGLVNDIIAEFGNRTCVLCREMTKIYEETWRGSLEELFKVLSQRRLKGEITLVVSGAT